MMQVKNGAVKSQVFTVFYKKFVLQPTFSKFVLRNLIKKFEEKIYYVIEKLYQNRKIQEELAYVYDYGFHTMHRIILQENQNAFDKIAEHGNIFIIKT